MKAEIAERIRLINKGQVPEGYKKNEIGIIPIDWNLKLLDEIVIYDNQRVQVSYCMKQIVSNYQSICLDKVEDLKLFKI